MAQKTVVQLVDDLDNRELNGDGQTITFALQKTQYEIDLSSQNVEKLRNALAPFIAAGRRVGAGRSNGVSSPKAKSDPEQLQAIRHWAREQGMKVSDRGRLSKEVQEAYHAAH